MPVVAASSADEFWSEYNSQIALLQSEIAGAEQPSDLVILRDKFADMQNFTTESTLVLANYDLKRAQEILETVSKYIKDKENKMLPRKKFYFKSKKLLFERMRTEIEVKKTKSGGQQSEQNMSPGVANATDDSTLYIVKEKKGDRIVLTTEMIGMANGMMRSLLIRNCKGMTLFARCVLGAVRLENCEDCRIFLGPCSTSVYLDSIFRGSVYICCHQLRIHKSQDVQLYVRVNGHPIIEDCTGMGFAPYAVSYPTFNDDLKTTGLQDAQCWSNVIDFRWHRTTQSPNWHVLGVQDRTIRETGPDSGTKWGYYDGEPIDLQGSKDITGQEASNNNNNNNNSNILPPRPPPSVAHTSATAGMTAKGEHEDTERECGDQEDEQEDEEEDEI